MTKTAHSVTPGVLEDILARLATISPEQQRVPEHERKEGQDAIGYADDYLKRLFTLSVLLAEEARPLAEELDELSKLFLQAAKESDSMEKTIRYFSSNPEDKLQKWARLQYLNEELSFCRRRSEFLRDLFWLETRLRVSGTAGVPSVSIRSDWSFVDDTEELKAAMQKDAQDFVDSLSDLADAASS